MKGKKIKDYQNYSATEDGTIWSYAQTEKGRPLKPQNASQSKKKYHQVRLFSPDTPNGKLQYVHRLVWEAFKGEIPKDKEIDHIDNNPNNNHLSNLQLITRRGNMMKFNREKYGELSFDLYNEIKELDKQGVSKTEIAKKIGKSYTTIWRVLKGKRQRRIKDKYYYEDYDYSKKYTM